MNKKYNIAVIGSTGTVGREVINILAERNFPINSIRPLASKSSIGKFVSYGDEEIAVDALDHNTDFGQFDIAFFCAGSGVAREYISKAVEQNCIVIDKSSHFRMDEQVPLIVPEANISKLDKFEHGIIANPNCCVIPLAVALKPLDNAAKIKRLVISTYQSVSGQGKKAMDELYDQTKAKFSFGNVESQVFPCQIAFNLIPDIGGILESGDSDEEEKIKLELQKIVGEHVQSSVTCVRVPVFVSHSMSVNVEFERSLDCDEAEEILGESDGILVFNDQGKVQYSTPVDTVASDAVLVSRIRQDHSRQNSLNMWVSCNNLRKGAALNAVQIAEYVIGNR